MSKEANTSSNKPFRKLYFQLFEVCRNRGRIGRIAGLVVLVFILLFLRADWREIGFGTLAFIAGSALLVWTDERKEGKSSKWRKLLKGIFVPIILAIGGLLTTHGWNMRDNYFHDRAMFVAMAAELNINRICLDILNVTYAEYKVKGEQEIMTALLSPNTNHIRQVLSFSNLYSNDKKLQDMMFQYVFAADILNAKIEQIDRVCSMHIVSNDMANELVESAFGEEHIFNVFFKLHKELAGYIVSNYSWCYEEASNNIRKPIVDAFNLSIAKKYIHLNSLEHQKRMQQFRDIIQQQGELIPGPNDDLNSRTGKDPND